MGSMTWEKMGRELGPVSPTRTVFPWKAFPKRATWGGLLSPAREPAASWPGEPHQEALPTQPCSHQISEAVMEQICCSSTKGAPRTIAIRLRPGDWRQGKSFRAG